MSDEMTVSQFAEAVETILGRPLPIYVDAGGFLPRREWGARAIVAHGTLPACEDGVTIEGAGSTAEQAMRRLLAALERHRELLQALGADVDTQVLADHIQAHRLAGTLGEEVEHAGV
ncbi:MAG: hypothetical protein GY812_17745 [Actinomycetia bacterium]|nr:hypothetical protein [Actinomycetes bacterium]